MSQEDVPCGEMTFTNAWKQENARYNKDIQNRCVFCCDGRNW